jgi:hypothetical protein
MTTSANPAASTGNPANLSGFYADQENAKRI